MDQIEELNPPENPAKTTDSRFESYMRKYGTSSWELDALSPAYIADLVRRETEAVIDNELWSERLGEIESTKSKIREIAEQFED
jgi:hypothetical protein